MRNVCKILIIVVILAIFTLPASADSAESYIEDFESGLPDKYREMAMGDTMADIGVGALVREAISTAVGRGGEIVSFLLLMLGGVALISVATIISGRLGETASVGVSVVVCCAALSRMAPLFYEVVESVRVMSDIFAVFVPVASAISVAAGSVQTAAVSGVCMNIILSVLQRLGAPFFLGLCGLGLGVGIISSFGDENLAPLAGSVRKFFVWALGLTSALLMGAMSLQSFVASTRDCASMRAAKYAASSMIPMVGSTVAGAMSTLATGLTYAKGVVGAACVTALVAVFLSPLIMLLLYRLAVSAAVGLSGFIGVRRGVCTFEALRLPFDLFIAAYALAAVIYIFEVALFLAVGVVSG